MSYHIWPETGYGLIYQHNEELKDITSLILDEDDDFSEYDLTDYGAYVIDEECDGEYSTDIFGGKQLSDPWIWFPCNKAALLLKPAYSSWQEVAQEFIERYTDVLKLPDLDNEEWWVNHLGYVQYAQGG